MTDEDVYIPGACNIGKREVTRRRNTTLLTLVITIGTIALLFAPGTDKWYRLVLVVPATALGVTFLQWRTKFCIAYAYWGYFNFKEVIKPSRVKNDEFRKLDMIKVRSILLKAILFGIALTLSAFLVP